MVKPQWLPENSISGCNQLIQEYWIRESATNKVDIDNNYTGQDDQISSYMSNSECDESQESQPSNYSYAQPFTTSHVESHGRSRFRDVPKDESHSRSRGGDSSLQSSSSSRKSTIIQKWNFSQSSDKVNNI